MRYKVNAKTTTSREREGSAGTAAKHDCGDAGEADTETEYRHLVVRRNVMSIWTTNLALGDILSPHKSMICVVFVPVVYVKVAVVAPPNVPSAPPDLVGGPHAERVDQKLSYSGTLSSFGESNLA